MQICKRAGIIVIDAYPIYSITGLTYSKDSAIRTCYYREI